MESFKVSSRIWKTKGKGGWYFVTFSKAKTSEIKKLYLKHMEGWGRLKVIASSANVTWNTSIWYDSKAGRYLLPIKAEIRKKLRVSEGDRISIEISVDADEVSQAFDQLDF